MTRKKPAPHLLRGGHRFSEKIMLKTKRWSGMTIRRKVIPLQTKEKGGRWMRPPLFYFDRPYFVT
jgi:hypothetical protein